MQRLAAMLTDRSAQAISRRLVQLGLRTKGIQPKRGKEPAKATFMSKSLDELETEAVQLLEACERVATHPKLRARHMASGFSWLLSVFKEAKEDREESMWESIREKKRKESPADYPLIPLSTENWELLKRPWVDRVFAAMCVRAPKQGESFFRIPSELPDNKIDLVIRIIQGWFGDRELDPNGEDHATHAPPEATPEDGEAPIEKEGVKEGGDAVVEEEEPEDLDDPEKSWEHQIDIDALDERGIGDASGEESTEDEWGDEDDEQEGGDGGNQGRTKKSAPVSAPRRTRSRKAKKAAATKISDGTATLDAAVTAVGGDEGQEEGAMSSDAESSAWEGSGSDEDAKPKKRLKKSKESKEERAGL